MMDIAQATHLDVEAGVRYWEDASVNGVDEDNDAPTIFGVNGDTWRIRINIAEGRINSKPIVLRNAPVTLRGGKMR